MAEQYGRQSDTAKHRRDCVSDECRTRLSTTWEQVYYDDVDTLGVKLDYIRPKVSRALASSRSAMTTANPSSGSCCASSTAAWSIRRHPRCGRSRSSRRQHLYAADGPAGPDSKRRRGRLWSRLRPPLQPIDVAPTAPWLGRTYPVTEQVTGRSTIPRWAARPTLDRAPCMRSGATWPATGPYPRVQRSKLQDHDSDGHVAGGATYATISSVPLTVLRPADEQSPASWSRATRARLMDPSSTPRT